MAIISSKYSIMIQRAGVSLAVCLSTFLISGCGSEFGILLDKDQLFNVSISSMVPSTVYWSEKAGYIKKASSSGFGETTLHTTPETPLDIALHLPGHKIYWTSVLSGVSSIYYSNLDGTGSNQFASYLQAANDLALSEIAIDSDNAMIYYNIYQNASGHNDIWRVPLSSVDPSSDQVKWENDLFRRYTFCIALDTVNREIYITANTYWDIGTILGSDDDGSMYIADMDTQNSYSFQFGSAGPGATSVPLRGIAVDASGGYVYYVNNAWYAFTISRRDLALENEVVWITADGFDIQKLALDLDKRKIYWTSRDPNRIYRANIDQPESGIELFRQLSSEPTGIAVSY